MQEMYLRGILQSPYIAMVSTPNAPDGLFERIEKDPKIPVYTKEYS
ncbi:MAG: hypothetical protein ACJ72R_01280 [Nitrososphaeraceae archaeon]|jgi:hypothetical protein